VAAGAQRTSRVTHLGRRSGAVAAHDLKLEPGRLLVVADDLQHAGARLVAQEEAIVERHPRQRTGRGALGHRDHDPRRIEVIRCRRLALQGAPQGDQGEIERRARELPAPGGVFELREQPRERKRHVVIRAVPVAPAEDPVEQRRPARRQVRAGIVRVDGPHAALLRRRGSDRVLVLSRGAGGQVATEERHHVVDGRGVSETIVVPSRAGAAFTGARIVEARVGTGIGHGLDARVRLEACVRARRGFGGGEQREPRRVRQWCLRTGLRRDRDHRRDRWRCASAAGFRPQHCPQRRVAPPQDCKARPVDLRNARQEAHGGARVAQAHLQIHHLAAAVAGAAPVVHEVVVDQKRRESPRRQRARPGLLVRPLAVASREQDHAGVRPRFDRQCEVGAYRVRGVAGPRTAPLRR
jgi:hypothetical protein